MTQIKVLLLLWLVVLIFGSFYFKTTDMTNIINVFIYRYHLNIDHQYKYCFKDIKNMQHMLLINVIRL